MITIYRDSDFNGIEIVLDQDGVKELMSYLIFIRDEVDHVHLTAGNELSEGKNKISHVKLVLDQGQE